MEEIGQGRENRVRVCWWHPKLALECSLCLTQCEATTLTCDWEGVLATCLFHIQRLLECGCGKVDIILHRLWLQWEEWVYQAREEDEARWILEHIVPEESCFPTTPSEGA